MSKRQERRYSMRDIAKMKAWMMLEEKFKDGDVEMSTEELCDFVVECVVAGVDLGMRGREDWLKRQRVGRGLQ